MDDVKTVSIVDIKPASQSKINATQVVSALSLLLAVGLGHQFELSSDVQTALVVVISWAFNFVTIIIKTYFTKTVTAQSAANTEFVMKDTPLIVVSKPE